MNSKSYVLILVPPKESMGGISNYYNVLKSKFSIPVIYCTRGTRNQGKNLSKISETVRMIVDYLVFLGELCTKSISIVHVNSSLGKQSVLRDGIYILLARVFRVKTVVYFRGWSDEACNVLEANYLTLFKFTYFRASAFITLSEGSKLRLQNWGYSRKIYLETTVVDENLVGDYDNLPRLSRDAEKVTILFLARLEVEKGIFELIEAFTDLINDFPDIRLCIAGSGSKERQVRDMIKGFPNIMLLGHLFGESKRDAYVDSDIYVLASYAEGMPNSVLEAMAFGLPVVCTPVGALSEIVQNDKNGIIVEVRSTELIKKALHRLITDSDLRKKMSQENFTFSKRFFSQNVVSRLEGIYKDIKVGEHL